LDANSDPANATRQLGSTTRFRKTKRPVLLDRVADENTGKRVKIEKTATGPKAAAQLGMNTRSKASRPREQALL